MALCPAERLFEPSRSSTQLLWRAVNLVISDRDAGFTLPVLDEHGGEETVYVLEGTFVDQYRTSDAGTVIRGAPGSSHQPGTPDGVTFIVTRTLLPGERERIAPSSTPIL